MSFIEDRLLRVVVLFTFMDSVGGDGATLGHPACGCDQEVIEPAAVATKVPPVPHSPGVYRVMEEQEVAWLGPLVGLSLGHGNSHFLASPLGQALC